MATDKGFEDILKNHKRRPKDIRMLAGVTAIALVASQSLMAYAAGIGAIKAITVDANQQLIIQFASNGSFPTVPHLLDLPGPSHRVVFDFVNATLDKGNLPNSETLSNQITKRLPGIKALRYTNLTNTPKPTARIVLDLPESLEVKPKVVKLEEGLVVLSFGDGVDLSSKGLTAPASAVVEESRSSAAASRDEGMGQEVGGSSTETASPQASAPVPGEAVAEAPGTPRATANPADNPQGSWDWTGGQASGQSTPGVATQSSEGENAPQAQAAPPAENPQADAAIQAELLREAGADPLPGQQVALKPAIPEPTTSAVPEKKTAPAVVESPAVPVAVKTAPVVKTVAPVAKAPVKVAQAAPVPTSARAPEPGSAPTASIFSDDPLPEAPPVKSASAPVPRKAAPVATPEAEESPEEFVMADETPEKKPSKAVVEADAAADEAQLQTLKRGATSADSKVEAKAIYNKAVQAHLSGNLPDAISQYQEALSINPEFSQAHCNLGLIYNQQHLYAKALSEFRKSLAIDPKDAITYNGIGAALRAQKDMIGAIKNWQTAVSLDPKLATAHYNLGTAYEMQKDMEKAFDSYKLAVKNDYKLGEAYYRMGLILEKQNQKEEATQNFTQALKVASNAEYSDDARQRIATLTNKKGAKK